MWDLINQKDVHNLKKKKKHKICTTGKKRTTRLENLVKGKVCIKKNFNKMQQQDKYEVLEISDAGP